MIGELHWLRPYCLLALLPLALLLWMYWRRAYDSRNWQAICDAELLPHLLTENRQRRSYWPLLLLALTGVLAILALAGPAWQQLPQPVFRDQSALVIVLDLSRSMDAADITPSRLARARHKVNDILTRRLEGQTALVVYAGDAHTVSPLTQDSGTIVNLVKTLDTGLMPVQGSRTDKALTLAARLLQQAGVAAGQILLITDGVAAADIGDLADSVRGQGHRLSVLGIGTAQGAPIGISGGGYLKDNTGAIVLPKLDTDNLQRLAQQAGGRYETLSVDDHDLDALLAAGSNLNVGERVDDDSLLTDRWREEGPWLLLLVLPLAALAFRRGYLVLIAFIVLPVIAPPAQALDLNQAWGDLWTRPDQQAARVMQGDDNVAPEAALFQDPAWQAAAHYRAGQFEQAAMALQAAATADDFYNRGNALARMGHWQEAIGSYDRALQLAPDHEDARFNRELVQQQLQQQDQQQSEQASNPESDQRQDNNQGQQTGDNNSGGTDSGQDNKETSSSASDKDGSEDGQGASQPEADARGSTANNNKTQDDAADTPGDDELARAEQQINQSAEQNAEQNAEQDEGRAMSDSLMKSEAMQASEQWLRRIPDDPGGLLRKKFLYEYQRKQQRQQTDGEATPW